MEVAIPFCSLGTISKDIHVDVLDTYGDGGADSIAGTYVDLIRRVPHGRASKQNVPAVAC